MAVQHSQQWEQFDRLVRKIMSYYEAIGLLHWDLRTGAPRKGTEIRSETIGVLSTEAFKLQISEEMGQLLSFFAEPEQAEQLDDRKRRMIAEVRKMYDQSKSIPPERFQEYSILAAQSETKWEEAKKNSDFEGFEPYLTKIVAFKQEFIEYWGVKDTRYDTLLDMYEPDLTVEKVDAIFERLKARLVPLVHAIQESSFKPETAFLKQLFPKEQQEKFSLFLLEQMGYDFEAGRLDESVHPFATGLNPGDVRITTMYLPDDVLSAVFSSLHEGGHALYEQNIDKTLAGTPLSGGTSMGIHESQSRLWENMIGRSRPFWRRYFADLQQYFPEQLKEVDVEQFYLAANKVENSLIRIEADELTYNLHIIIRYEIEKMLFNEGLAVKDLPETWNAKYKEYLGIMPTNDGMGVLQDVHWSGGDFGYFASYSLGNMYAAQMLHTMRKELPNLDQLIEEGNLAPIKEWLTDKVYKYGKSEKPSEIIVRITGEELNPDYLADYLEEKYKEIYKL
ncbi:Carboxypeptidase Taq [Paenibacillus vortex V453]|jgi:carboxypeptidase Taq|uniref:Metal-dependent carboxypeptidase n=2 Tax=Paenibacillus TaxID=44249 RepID=A0A163LMS8_9BACL|nr:MULTISPECIES: carboxypeptidase M32 [Paenibacillus]ANA82165.1 peptidase M32 [Paenibacillus glucanolyticus]AVV59098.1 carboxypeptidase M32 [Paenibacillus glucanolyticus]AWP28265.1 carboxypeptidase M32 [Paenibacillus sp. Cedars]EFU41530.1 Carboxypeptidase Taq [Paenibacillus vortex V453]ETT42653.1 carboxypeptidase Taq [Paenibacillus sp. FSL R5-808]